DEMKSSSTGPTSGLTPMERTRGWIGMVRLGVYVPDPRLRFQIASAPPAANDAQAFGQSYPDEPTSHFTGAAAPQGEIQSPSDGLHVFERPSVARMTPSGRLQSAFGSGRIVNDVPWESGRVAVSAV